MAVLKAIINAKLKQLYSAKYPKKVGKTAGLRRANLQVKTLEDLALFEEAIQRYNDRIKNENIEPRFVKQFDTFVTSWRDCLDPDYGTVAEQKVDLSGAGFD